MKGSRSDVVEKFFRTTESAVLFPEFVSRVVRQGMEEEVQQSLIRQRPCRAADRTVPHGERFGGIVVALALGIRFQRLDLFSITLRQIGSHIARMHLEDAIKGPFPGRSCGPDRSACRWA